MEQAGYGEWTTRTADAIADCLGLKAIDWRLRGPWPAHCVDASLPGGGRILCERWRVPYLDIDALCRPVRVRTAEGVVLEGPTPPHGAWSHDDLGLPPTGPRQRQAQATWARHAQRLEAAETRWMAYEHVTGHLTKTVAIGVELDVDDLRPIVEGGLSALWGIERGDGPFAGCTPAEVGATELAASGFTRKEIAGAWFSTVGTVETYLARAAAKAGDGSTRSLMRAARWCGLLDYRCRGECVGHPGRADPLPRCPMTGVLAVSLGPAPGCDWGWATTARDS